MEMFSPNPARSLTAGRIPYALGGGMLGDNPGFWFDPTNRRVCSVGGVGERPGFYVENTAPDAGNYSAQAMFHLTTLGAPLGALKATVSNLSGLSTRSLFLTTAGPWPLAFGHNDSATPSAVAWSNGRWSFGYQSDPGNGLLQLVTHTTPGGGVGFYDFSLYRAGAQLAALNASLSLSGQCVPGYGTFALPALVPGDSGNGLYCEDPGSGRVLYFKGYGGRSAFRNSTNTGNILALSDAGPDSSTGYMVNGTQVVGPKVAGWTAATGHTIRRGLNIPTAGLTETMDVLATLINDLRSHGLI